MYARRMGLCRKGRQRPPNVDPYALVLTFPPTRPVRASERDLRGWMMGKAVLISIQPKWCRLIESGEKTVEVRKTRPKLETPFKCYIYCTLSGCNEFFRETLQADVARWNKGKWGSKKGCVIGEFACSGFDEFTPTEHGVEFKRFFALHDSGLSADELRSYLNGKPGYGWRISDL